MRAVTDIGGSEIARHDYSTFGEEITSAAGIDTRRFGGKERDAETGLSYFGARYYSPGTGRFARADDLGFGNPFAPQTMNGYGFTMGNPLRWTDPTGHLADCGPYDGCVSAPLPTPIDFFFNRPWQGPSGNSAPDAPGGAYAAPAQGTTGRKTDLVPANPCVWQGGSKSIADYAVLGFMDGRGTPNLVARTGGALLNAVQFFGGLPLDGGHLSNGPTVYERSAYGNYAFGVYNAAAGRSLRTTLTVANVFGRLASDYSKYPFAMDSQYRYIPAANVSNIKNGYNALVKGTLCSSQK